MLCYYPDVKTMSYVRSSSDARECRPREERACRRREGEEKTGDGSEGDPGGGRGAGQNQDR